jgi:formamidopyrimidine-DNA glycosylase
MPELPEVENVVRGLREPLTGRTVVGARLARRDLYRAGSRPLTRLAGSRITAVERLGKAILVRLSPPRDHVLAVHLGMTGTLAVEPGRGVMTQSDGDAKSRRHRHGVVHLDDGARLVYRDPRRFGFLWVGPAADLSRLLNIGPDPFQLDARQLRARLENRTAPVKSLLLDQRLVSGLGNIYADEILFFSGVHPLTPGGEAAPAAATLLRKSREVLRRAIRHGGTTIRDYRGVDGSPGAFQTRLSVYGREGEPCIRCGAAIERIVIAARSAHYCPDCQNRR